MSASTIINGTKMPKVYENMTADEAAETVSYHSYLNALEDGKGMELYGKLYDFLNTCERPTTRGGDGSDGTAETPSDVEQGNDTGTHWWRILDEHEKQALIAAGGE